MFSSIPTVFLPLFLLMKHFGIDITWANFFSPKGWFAQRYFEMIEQLRALF